MTSIKKENYENKQCRKRTRAIPIRPDSPENDVIKMAEEKDPAAKSSPKTTKPKYGIKKFLKTVYKLSRSHVGLILLLVFYSFIGAVLFNWIEGDNEIKVLASIREDRARFLGVFANSSQSACRNDTFLVESPIVLETMLRDYESKLIEAMKHGISLEGEQGPGSTEHREWTLWGSLFFSATIYTTIGYGHIAPSTPSGRVVTMLYAILGIPLCLIVLADLGAVFTRLLKFLWSFVYRCYRQGKCVMCRKKVKTVPDVKQDPDDVDYAVKVDDEFNLHPVVAIGVVVVYIFLGSVMYKYWEDWSYLDAFYFIFITISTIGFGDVIPDHPKYFMATSIYILIGLSLVAMVINVYIDFVNNTIVKATGRISEVSKKIGISLIHVDDEGENEDEAQKDSETKDTTERKETSPTKEDSG